MKATGAEILDFAAFCDNKLLAECLMGNGNDLATVEISVFCGTMLSNSSFNCRFTEKSRDFYTVGVIYR